MTGSVVNIVTDPSFLLAVLVSVAVFATLFTALPALSGNPLKARMKAVARARAPGRAPPQGRRATEAAPPPPRRP
ncbi:MAG: hypothetical protein ACK4R3_13605, partial [Aliihoeflea sp.]